MTDETCTNGKLKELKDWELDRLMTACDVIIAHYRRTLSNPVAYHKALVLKGQIRSEFQYRKVYPFN